MSDETAQPSADATGDDEVKNRRLAAVQKAADLDGASTDQIEAELSPGEAQDATDWFVSDEVEEAGWKDIDVNVANGEKAHWVRFRVGALDRDRITAIRKQNMRTVVDAKGNETKEPNESAINSRVAAEGLVRPDLKRPEMRRVRGQDFMDPADALDARFAHKPGIVDQIAGYVVDVTGYNDSDVKEVQAGKS